MRYDLSKDPGETNNVATQHPDRVKAMEALLRKLKEDGMPHNGQWVMGNR
ncbi:MAG: hypothetical protein ACREEM_03395 [Blastocatellia bacterium]